MKHMTTRMEPCNETTHQAPNVLTRNMTLRLKICEEQDFQTQPHSTSSMKLKKKQSGLSGTNDASQG